MKNLNIKEFADCPFYAEQIDNYENPLKRPRIVLETENLYAVPGVGAFIPN